MRLIARLLWPLAVQLNTHSLQRRRIVVFYGYIMQINFELGLDIVRPQGYLVVPLTLVEVFRHIAETNICALIVSIISIAFLLTIKVTGVN